VPSSAVARQQVDSLRLPSANSICSAKTNAICLVLKLVASSDKGKIMIFSDYITIGYRIIQSVVGFLVNVCVAINTYMTRNPRNNDLLADSNKVFINCYYP
jgi:hypothetical protein